jgi:RimJ/RimL family protein N-acetyltransferase
VQTFATARLTARPIQADDFDVLSVLHHDIRVMATLGGIRDDDTTREFLREKLEHWRRHGFGMWMFHHRETGEFIGRGGLQHIEVAGRQEVELGYTVRAEYAGNGYATEMARAMVDVGFGDIGLAEIVAFTLPTNVASRRVMEKAGFAFEREFVHLGLDHVLYRIRAEGR